jgi:hypothetical protein
MKTINTLVLSGAVVLGFTLASANAEEAFFSPRAAQQRHELRTVPSTDSTPNLVSNSYLGAASKRSDGANLATGGTSTQSLVSGNYQGAAAKNPNNGARRFEIAPMAKPSK